MTADALREVRDFETLVTFLAEELDWPLGEHDFEDVTFEYSAEEVGLNAEAAAKVESIRRLRPLTAGQPFGVFFIEFEPKRLPVVALRRILNGVVTKKRQLGSAADRQTWSMDQLLFISAVGDSKNRKIAFASFAGSEERALPTLRVLGWDDDDTEMQLTHVAERLSSMLSWPEDESDAKSWIERWGSAFSLEHREVITSSRLLAERLAGLAKTIKQRVIELLAVEGPSGPTRALFESFREVLIDDLDESGFADLYAQTIAYGHLSASFVRETADLAGSDLLTTTFLSDLMGSLLANPGADFDELGLAELEALTARTDLAAVSRDFGNRDRSEDPIIHFYELFLETYDPDERKEQGVFYTPQPVVEYIVASADQVLRKEFGLAYGLADVTTWGELEERGLVVCPEGREPTLPFVQILDPAAGTGTFLVEVVDRIHRTMQAAWAEAGLGKTERLDAWNEYVDTALLPRLHGFELMAAPYAIAHLRVGLKLAETGYRFSGDSHLRIFLTDTLAPSRASEGTLEFEDDTISVERRRSDEVKDNAVITVIVGNPPYRERARGRGGVVELPDDGTRRSPSLDLFREPGQGRAEFNLHNLNVYFWRWATWKALDSNDGYGIVSFITTSPYLTSPAFQGFRRWVREHCASGTVIDCTPEGHQPDVPTRLFAGVQQPLAILTLNGSLAAGQTGAVRYGSITGSQAQKFEALVGLAQDSAGEWAKTPAGSTAAWLPVGSEMWEAAPTLLDLMPFKSTGLTANRPWVNAPHPDVLRERWEVLTTSSSEDAPSLFKETRDRDLSRRVKPLPQYPGLEPLKSDPTLLEPVPVAWRSFDVQWIYPDSRVLDMPRPALWGERGDGQVFVVELHSEPLRPGPALVFSAEIPESSYFKGRGGRVYPSTLNEAPNVAAPFVERWADLVGDPSLATAEALVQYLAGVAGFASFTRKFEHDLKVPGVRIPMSLDPTLVDRARLFGTVVLCANTRRCRYSFDALDTLGIKPPEAPTMKIPIPVGPGMPDTMSFDLERGELSVGEGLIAGVSPAAVDYQTSGMNVLRKWFGYRKANPSGRTSEGLNGINASHWYPEWTTDLLGLLEDLAILSACEPAHVSMLDDLVEGPLVTLAELGAGSAERVDG